jgi:hypothetical protein
VAAAAGGGREGGADRLTLTTQIGVHRVSTYATAGV